MTIADIEQIGAPAAGALDEAGVAWTYDYWENLPAAEYARRQGVQPVNDFSVIFGAGAAEDWEGFDEAVELWRAENPVK
jgi:hypothetical protein